MRYLLFPIGAILFAAAAIAASEATQPTTPSTPTQATAAPGTPPAAAAPKQADADPIVAAVMRAYDMQLQAANAAEKALSNAAQGETSLKDAQRQLLIASALLYNSSAQLGPIAKKELMRAEKWQLLGEQRERAAQSLEEDEEPEAAKKNAKAFVAYGTAHATIAESMQDLAAKQKELAKEAEAATKGNESAPLEKSARSIVAANKAAQDLADGIREARAKLDKLAP